MNYNFEELGRILSEYYQYIENDVIEKLRNQNNHVFKTNRGEYEIIKIERIRLDKLFIDKEKFHHLFSSNGCKISGNILVKAQAYPPHSDRNGFTSLFFEIVFNPTAIKFDFDKETFSIEEDINFSFISLSERCFY